MQSMQKGLLMSNKYTYESPDNGKTVYRRAFGHCDKEVQVGLNWFSFDQAKAIVVKQQEEEKLREQYPALKNAWEDYQMILKLLMEKKNETR